MNKSAKRILATLLAALMVLGLSTAAAAAPPPKQYESAAAPAVDLQAAPNWTMSITTQPTNTSFTMHMEDPNLAGMVISVSGGIFTTPASIAYNTVSNDDVQALNKILWDFHVWPNEDRWVVGNNAATLYVYAWQCTEFIPLFTDNGTEYGYFDTEVVFRASVPITVVATPFDLSGITRPLALTPPAVMTLVKDVYNSEVFEFIAPSDGYYSFKSTGGQYGGTFYSVEGDVIERDYVDPWAELYDKDGYYLGWDDDRGGNYNFAIYQQLKAGDKVYLVVGGWASETANITVTAARVADTQPVLALGSNDITVIFHEYIDLDALLEGTGLKARDVSVRCDWDYIDGWWYYGYYGIKRGATTLTIEAPDGSAATVNITIKYSAMQWLCVILLGGWAWMPLTSIGPFNLFREIGYLFQRGLVRGLFDLFFHWRYGLFNRFLPL